MNNDDDEIIIVDENDDEVIIVDENNNDEIIIQDDAPIYIGTRDYEELDHQPQVNEVTLIGNKTLDDLGIINDKTYLHIQSVPSNEWIINHNLNKYPAVSIIDSAENEVIGEVEYVDNNNIILRFAASFSGKATLN